MGGAGNRLEASLLPRLAVDASCQQDLGNAVGLDTYASSLHAD